MTLAHRYDEFHEEPEEFGGESGETAASAEANLQAFENGYQAGWQDAMAAHETDQNRMSAELSQKFQEMSFTYHEARSKLLSSLQPVAAAMIEKLLPGLMRESLRANLAEQLEDILQQSTENAIELVVAPAQLEIVQEHMELQPGVPFALKAEPSLGEGQVYLKVDQTERRIDIEDLYEQISQSLSCFVQQSTMEASHG